MVRKQEALFFGALILLLVCNVLDAAFTVCAIEFGDATEANPLMAVLLAKGALFFVLVKHGLVSMSTVLLSTLRNHWLARAGLWAATPVYCLLILYHVSMALVGGYQP